MELCIEKIPELLKFYQFLFLRYSSHCFAKYLCTNSFIAICSVSLMLEETEAISYQKVINCASTVSLNAERRRGRTLFQE